MSVKVIAHLNPFSSERKEFSFDNNESIQEIIKAIGAYKSSMARVLIDDEKVLDFNRVPREGSTVYLKFVPEGSGGDTKQTGNKMTSWGVATAIVGFGLLFVPGAQAIGVSLMLTGGSMIASGYAISNIDIPNLGDREKPQQRPGIRGSRNRENQYGYIPVVLGKHRLYPDVAAKSYTVIEGNDQWLVQLFCAGYKDISIDYSTFKLGDTKLIEYSSTGEIFQILGGQDSVVKLEIIRNGNPSTLYPKVCREQQINGVLKNKRDDGTDGGLVNTTPDKTTSLNVDIFFYNGLGRYNDDGDVVGTSVEVVAYYKKESAPDSAYISFGPWDGVGGTVISGSELKTKRYQVSKTGLPAGKYTVKVVRMSGDSTDTKVIDAVYLGSIRAFSDEKPVRPERAVDLTIIGLKIKATDRLSNTIDTLNFIAQSMIPAYSGAGTGPGSWITGNTQNPAAMLKYVLQGRINSVPVADSDIDWASLEKWGNWCSDHGYDCNTVISNKMTLSDLTMAIARTGRAETVKIDSRFSVVHDGIRESPVQLFTPRNTKAYQQTIAFSDIPDAIELGFIDETAGYSDNDRVVYNTDDGQQGNEEPRTKQSESLWGITKPSQAFLIGRYEYACAKLRPRFHRIDVDFEYLMCTKGDRIQYAGDTALIGTAYGRIKTIVVYGENIVKIELDEYVTIEAGKNYGMRIRKADGDLILVNVHAAVGYTNLFYPDTALPAFNGPVAQDLVALGERGFETLDLIIMSINTVDDWNATLNCVDYSPGIFGIDDPGYVIPDFESLITAGGVIDSGVVAPNDWKVFETYHDSLAEPNAPLGNGSSDGWHWTITQNSKWRSTKVGKTRSESTWGPPIPTATQVSAELKYGTEQDIPDDITTVTAIARQDYIEIDWEWNGDTLANSVKRFIFELSKDSGVTWVVSGYTTASRYTYYFNRSIEIDGYPEKTTGPRPLVDWRVRVRAENIYGQVSLGYGPSAAGQALDVSGYKTWIPAKPTVSILRATETGLEYTIDIDESSFYGSNKRYTLALNGTDRQSNIRDKTGLLLFNRAVDGYPEKATERSAHDISTGTSLNDFLFTAKVFTDENSAGVISDGKKPDVSVYKTWIPHVPAFAVAAAGRNVTLRFTPGNSCYGGVAYRFQVQKSTDGINYYAAGNNENAWSDETAYRTGAAGGYSSTPLETYVQVVPLTKQSEDLPEDTTYNYRACAVQDVLASQGGVYISAYTNVATAIARATAVKDIVAGAVKNAQLAPGAVTNDKISARTIQAENISVTARSKINTFNDLDDGLTGWTTGGTIITVDNSRALKLTAPDNSFTTTPFTVEPDEILAFSFGLQCPNYTSASGLFIGLTAAQTFIPYTWSFTAKKWQAGTAGKNKYFVIDYKATTRKNFKTYILGSSVDITEVPAPTYTDESYAIICLKLMTGDRSASIRSGYNATTAGTYWYLFNPLVVSIGASKIVAEQIQVTSLAAINSRLGKVEGDDAANYKLVLGQGFADPEGTFLLGAVTDASYFRRWKEGNEWKLAIKLATLFVDAVSSKILGKFQVRTADDKDSIMDVDQNSVVVYRPLIVKDAVGTKTHEFSPAQTAINTDLTTGSIFCDGQLTMQGDILPAYDRNRNIGSSAVRFLKIYSQEFIGVNGVCMTSYDGWLRLNPFNDHTAGIYCGSKILRTDGELQVGENGSSLKVNSTGAWAKTPVTSDNSTRIATTAYVKAQVSVGVYPVGCFYTQYPNASSNTDDIEFPVSQRPASLFGGTWVEQWAAESVFFRTRGPMSDSVRVNGYQEDGIRSHKHPMHDGSAVVLGAGDSGAGYAYSTSYRAAISLTSYNTGYNSDYATETRSRNRRIKVWKRTA